jgi:hypothetical protein
VRRRLAATDDTHVRALLSAGLDWSCLLNLGDRHHLLPLLHECLAAAGDVGIPRAVLRALEWKLAATQIRNTRLAQELVRLHRLAAAAEIPMLSFKGPVLATAVYGALGLRQFGDLDVLVDPASLATAENLLATLGYQRVRDYGYETTLVNDTTGICIDLHRHLSPDNFPMSAPFARLWARREVVHLEGGCVDTLGAGDLLIALSVEAVKDTRRGKITLNKVSDLGHLLRILSKTNASVVEEEARRLGIERVLRFGIQLPLDVLDIPALGPFDRIACPRWLGVAVREAEQILSDDPNRRTPSRWRQDRFHFHLRERWRDRVYPYTQHVRRLITPNVSDRKVAVLPRSLSFLYCLIRPVRLARQHGPRLIRKTFTS